MGGSRHHPERAARRVSLQQRYEDDAARQQREKKLERGEDELVPVDLRDDPSVPDEFVKELSCYGGGVKSLPVTVGSVYDVTGPAPVSLRAGMIWR